MKPLRTSQKRTAAFFVAVSVACGLSWVAGFDFNERGDDAFFVALMTLFAGVAAAAFPGWSDE